MSFKTITPAPARLNRCELAVPGSVRRPWYLNLNPTPGDVTDKSGNGHHPSWDGTTAQLWTP